MVSVIKAVSFDAADAVGLAAFWAAAGWGGPNMWFTRVPDGKRREVATFR